MPDATARGISARLTRSVSRDRNGLMTNPERTVFSSGMPEEEGKGEMRVVRREEREARRIWFGVSSVMGGYGG